MSMLAIISSTLFPSEKTMYQGTRSVIPAGERLAQTVETIGDLTGLGFREIHLADNSGGNWVEGTENALQNVKLHRYHQFQLNNKGINEIYMLLDLIDSLPPGLPILKISGRYRLLEDIRGEIEGFDFAVRLIDRPKTRIHMFTSCYLAANKEILKEFLEYTLYEHYAYYARIVGVRSLLRLFANSLAPGRRDFFFHDPAEPIEFAAAQALIRKKYRVNRLDYHIARGRAGANGGVWHLH